MYIILFNLVLPWSGGLRSVDREGKQELASQHLVYKTTMQRTPAASISAKSGLPLYSIGLSALSKKKALFIRFAKGSPGRWKETG